MTGKPGPKQSTVRPAPPWLAVAEGEVGHRELPGAGRTNPRIQAYHETTTVPRAMAREDETPWCSSFVNWSLRQVGIRGTNSAAARSWTTWGEQLAEPRMGAVCVIRRRAGAGGSTGTTSGFHVGFWTAATPDSVTLLGGNQSDQVKHSTFSLRAYDVVGYYWPLTRAQDLTTKARA